MTTNLLRLSLASGDALDVREFTVEEAMNRPFDIRLVAVCPNADVDFDAAAGRAARFEIDGGEGLTRSWTGVCAAIEIAAVEDQGLSTYEVRLAPSLWLLGHRRNYRVFQDKSELDIALAVLAEWGIEPALRLDAGSYRKRRMRTQYAESDLDFVSRLLEEIGVAYFFTEEGMVLADAPNRASPGAAVPFVDTPSSRMMEAYVTEVGTRRAVRPGRATQSDVDYRKPLHYPLSASASGGRGVEAQLERYTHEYGSFLWKGQGGDTPVADDRGAARTDQREGGKQVERRLDALRSEARVASFRTTAHDLAPGKVFTIADHPRRELAAPLLVVQSSFSGKVGEEWIHTCEARYTDVDYRPPLATPKPRTRGVESATVTGPAGEEIHTDEFGRVRVKFHWDREGAADETSSSWVPVSQPWAGAGLGAVNLPRVGQEVLVDFLGADPDRPLVMGRVFTTTTPPPYQLPKHKTVSGLRSESYPRPKQGGAARMGGDPGAPAASAPIGGGRVVCNIGGGPLGGGLVVEELGAEPGGGDSQVPLGTPGNVPEAPHITPPARPEELRQAIDRMRALGPDGVDNSRSANGVVFADPATRELLYIQAQHDLRITAKNNFTGSVGANRAFYVHRNDYEEITEGYQAVKVAQDRAVAVVEGKQSHSVEKDIVVDGKKNHLVFTEKDVVSQSTEGGMVFDSKKGFLFRIGEETAILMTPTGIMVESEKLFINPGPEYLVALMAGKSVAEAEAAQDGPDRVERATQAMLMFDRDFAMTHRDAQRSLWDTARTGRYGYVGPNYANAAQSVGVTDQASIQAGARAAYEAQYGPLPARRP